jgi:predicted Kef-type K+ transport protein
MLVTLVGFAFLFGLALSRVGLPPMVGFLLAGFAYNFAGFPQPEGLGLVADLGITLLLFTIGLKLDVKALAKSEIWATSLAHIILSTLLFSGVILIGQKLFPIKLLDISFAQAMILGFAFSFSSTVFAVKVLEEKGDMTAFYGKVAIGILVMQDIFAVLFLAVSEGQYPNAWALSLVLLPFLRKILFKLLDLAGHGELLVLSGLFFALAVGYEYFYAMDLKGDLGALILGVLLANHPKANELSKSLFSFKELMLVGFFLSVGMQGLPTATVLVASALLCLLLPLKTFLYYLIISFSGLRSRTSLLVSLNLANYSEFGLVVAALGATQGWLSVDWLLIMAICVSLSFGLASPFSLASENIYKRYKKVWDFFQTKKIHPRDKVIDTADARVLVIGMGRVGSGAYDDLAPVFDDKILGIEHSAERVDTLRGGGRRVLLGDATDTDFWSKLKAGNHIELVVLAMPSHGSNIYAARQIRNLGVQCTVVAVAKFPEEVEELAGLNVPAFNMYSEAGSGLARQALVALAKQSVNSA